MSNQSHFNFEEPPKATAPASWSKSPGGVVGAAARMHTQKDLEKRKGRKRRINAPNSIQDRFKEYHIKNPNVYRELVRMAKQLKARGFEFYSISGLIEVLRFKQSVTTGIETTERYTLSNDFRSRYARLVMDNNPDLDGFFKTRELRSL